MSRLFIVSTIHIFRPLNVNDPCGTFRDCSGNKDDGLYPDMEKDCQFYFVCANGVFKGHNPCPLGKYHTLNNYVSCSLTLTQKRNNRPK